MKISKLFFVCLLMSSNNFLLSDFLDRSASIPIFVCSKGDYNNIEIGRKIKSFKSINKENITEGVGLYYHFVRSSYSGKGEEYGGIFGKLHTKGLLLSPASFFSLGEPQSKPVGKSEEEQKKVSTNEEAKSSEKKEQEAKSTEQKQEEVIASKPSFSPEKSPYFTYNIFNVLNLVKDVKYRDERSIVFQLSDLYDPAFYDLEKYEKFVIDKGGINKHINWKALEELAPNITEESKKKYLQECMKVAVPVPVKNLFESYKKAKKMEITDAVFSGIKWPSPLKLEEARVLFKLVDSA